ncbi:uracil-DNA glycosylase [Clostridium ganghwense]|uniref:Uracil-DNA glycosylase n=1 Tax=Clostridium ganghwense TaxID=312089 RepID=A0ABT4CRD1_9CLOT|nr:uracil-DNA glycosylase [Clostridium ganghwense]MCY6371616.1 uracil-DNA glycosylase [Clostridium ganghwense]
MDTKKINCRKCKYFYITWDAKSPYGCRAMGFKTKLMPSLVVFQSTGKNCLYFNEKNTNKSS